MLAKCLLLYVNVERINREDLEHESHEIRMEFSASVLGIIGMLGEGGCCV